VGTRAGADGRSLLGRPCPTGLQCPRCLGVSTCAWSKAAPTSPCCVRGARTLTEADGLAVDHDVGRVVVKDRRNVLSLSSRASLLRQLTHRDEALAAHMPAAQHSTLTGNAFVV
jgi:hypothetical protein